MANYTTYIIGSNGYSTSANTTWQRDLIQYYAWIHYVDAPANPAPRVRVKEEYFATLITEEDEDA